MSGLCDGCSSLSKRALRHRWRALGTAVVLLTVVEVVNGERSFRDLDQKAVEHVIHAVDVANGHRGHALPSHFLNSKQTTRWKLLLSDEHLHLSRYIGPVKMFDGIAV